MCDVAQVLEPLGVHAVGRAGAGARAAGRALGRQPGHQRHVRARGPGAPRAHQLDRRLLRAAGDVLSYAPLFIFLLEAIFQKMFSR